MGCNKSPKCLTFKKETTQVGCVSNFLPKKMHFLPETVMVYKIPKKASPFCFNGDRNAWPFRQKLLRLRYGCKALRLGEIRSNFDLDLNTLGP